MVCLTFSAVALPPLATPPFAAVVGAAAGRLATIFFSPGLFKFFLTSCKNPGVGMPTSKSRLSNVAVSVLLRTGDADVNGVVVVDGVVEVLGDDSGNFGVVFAFGVDIVDGATTDEGDASGVVAATAVGRGGVIVLLLPLLPLAIFFLA